MKRSFFWNTFSCLFVALFAVAMLAVCSSARAEPAFNALDPGDPQHAEYQHNLCQVTLEVYNKLYAEKYWLDHLVPKLAAKSPAQREDWVVNYAVTASLRETWRDRYKAHCGGGARFVGEYDDPGTAGAAVINPYEREQARRKSPGNHNRSVPEEVEL
jgi:hypothetical protein